MILLQFFAPCCRSLPSRPFAFQRLPLNGRPQRPHLLSSAIEALAAAEEQRGMAAPFGNCRSHPHLLSLSLLQDLRDLISLFPLPCEPPSKRTLFFPCYNAVHSSLLSTHIHPHTQQTCRNSAKGKSTRSLPFSFLSCFLLFLSHLHGSALHTKPDCRPP